MKQRAADQCDRLLLNFSQRVKEQRSVVFKVNNQDEFFRGVSKELNEGCLFVETEEGINIKIEMDDIIEIYAIKSSSPGHISIQSPCLMRSSKEDLENLVLLLFKEKARKGIRIQ
ncbi:hypothetical protein NST33_16465 [Paenibacillus sp. FSL L8-0435]|uniref:hypothetical protein n=1 Tax=Paenibacillus sp. FSL L8-0435 TaxID=2954618 RepID=UPI0030DA7A25